MSAASGAGPGSLPAAGAGTTTRERPSDLRSAELVSRLLAATPPYLYNMPIVPHSYFFSEMLRSFVHAKNNADASRLSSQNAAQPTTHRRSRKRSWNQSKISPVPDASHAKPEWQQRSEHWQMRNAAQEERHYYDDKFNDVPLDSNKNHQHSYEKPLELTTHKSTLNKHANLRMPEVPEVDEKRESPDSEIQAKMRKSPKVLEAANHLKDEKFPGLLPPTAPLTLPPPPPPLWYPPLYPPPYGIDPLNFFIDLRVSGHIYDRKHGGKEATAPSQETPQPEVHTSPNSTPLIFENGNSSAFKENMKANRHVSAFSVPKPREANQKNFPMNLCHGSSKFNMKYYDDVDSRGKNSTNTHYVMQNLKRIYGDLTNHPEEGKATGGNREQEMSEDLDGANDSDSSETKKKKCKDLRALIGLELVVDYVKSGKGGGNASGGDEVVAEEE